MATLLAPDFELPAHLQQYTNLADTRIGAKVLECSDDFFAEASDSDMYAAIDSLMDKLDRQIVKHKEKHSEHRHESARKHAAE